MWQATLGTIMAASPCALFVKAASFGMHKLFIFCIHLVLPSRLWTSTILAFPGIPQTRHLDQCWAKVGNHNRQFIDWLTCPEKEDIKRSSKKSVVVLLFSFL